ncbi:MAG: hypothetical protein NTZ21_00190 [Actinobacteria bacterium]|nr:hypothetical protein [Actinomycetota bacterium]
MPTLSQAVHENVEWCDLVCRSLDVTTGRSDVLWWTHDDAPPLYPDVITTVADVSYEVLASLLDDRPTCTVKDSFGTLDLSGDGFVVLFDATWVVRAAGVPELADPGWEVMDDPDDLAAWEQGWRSGGGAPGGLSPALLQRAPVSFLAERVGERLVGGAVAHHAGGVLGMSNVFRVDEADGPAEPDPNHTANDPANDTASLWQRASSAVSWLAPELGVVGYERGLALDALRDVGFRPAGQLRVWRRG